MLITLFLTYARLWNGPKLSQTFAIIRLHIVDQKRFRFITGEELKKETGEAERGRKVFGLWGGRD
jgi:hypothetical protein